MAPLKFEWPAIEGLIAYCHQHGLYGAAERLDVSPSTLRAHMIREGCAPEDWQREKQGLREEALQEIADLIS
jgi:hypothetical protein